MKYMSHPFSGEVQAASPLMAKRLKRYGWTYTTKQAWVEYKRAQVQSAMIRNMPSMRSKLGRMQ